MQVWDAKANLFGLQNPLLSEARAGNDQAGDALFGAAHGAAPSPCIHRACAVSVDYLILIGVLTDFKNNFYSV